MAKKAKRTKAQRVAAAKAAWARRKAQAEQAKTPAIPQAAIAAATDIVEKVFIAPPRIVYAVREGDDIFACFGQDGSLSRERLDDTAARKLFKDLAAILY